MSVSVLILTLNEEANLLRCLKAVNWSDDIVVFDSYSSDKTVQVAKEFGARVIQRKFDNWSDHQNWAVKNIIFKNKWVYYTDADEQCDEKLKTELLQISDISENFSAFQLRRKDYFMGKWLKHAQLYPTWITRVFIPERIRYERLVNPIAVVDGYTGQLKGHIIHYPFSHGISHWYERHNKYSDMEAKELATEIAKNIDWSGLACKDAARRRKALKAVAYKLPFRPILMWLYIVFFRGAFLDGNAGIKYSFMRMTYEYMIDLKVLESKRKKKGLPI